MSTNTRPNIFAICTGAYGNVGDAVIRRLVVSWLRETRCRLHIYVGNAPDEWIEQLRLQPGDVIYRRRDLGAWMRALVLGRGSRALVFDPGEVPLERSALPLECLWLAITALLRVRNIRVVRPPRGIGRPARLSVLVHRIACKLSDAAFWRDLESLKTIRVGYPSPDTAFHESFDKRQEAGETRTKLVVSLRGSRPSPTEEWILGLNDFATRNGLSIVIASQVRSDEAACMLLKERTGWDYLPWPSDETSLSRERRLRCLYSECKVIVSDRLHALILAANSGAIPTELVVNPSGKVQSNFQQIGMEHVSMDATGLTRKQVATTLERSLELNSQFETYLEAAGRAVDDLRLRIRNVLTL